ncbi:hypothetical protein SAMN05518847_1207 [Paenibacillus sp. OV219]|nr:hypothetical protein SAMN05518847_1207 [Paenibacillus sp. OV219]
MSDDKNFNTKLHQKPRSTRFFIFYGSHFNVPKFGFRYMFVMELVPL